jgi:prephenate dehydrogenase
MSDKINVAVLGLGNMGSTHVRVAKESPCVGKIYGYAIILEQTTEGKNEQNI